ncbi:GFA family protein [Sneathiella aquimaris]|uniref:GFA family protein n=1 Tax=Sneathiella aquimaris TaxID=2599305 RepID=UPI00146B4174|nr:GFA family protein [Sneathiella aquimaris]
MIKARGGCLCGGVSFEVKTPVRNVVFCHCKQCRTAHGNFIGYTQSQLDGFHFVSDATLKWYASSKFATRGFCSECGSNMFWQEKGSDTINFTAGCLQEPTHLRSESHIFVGSAGDYYQLNDELPKYDKSD